MTNDGLEPEPFVEAVLPDPNQLRDLRVVTGFAGRSPREGFVRLYRNAALASYLAFPTQAVLHSIRLPESQDHLPQTIVWLPADAQVEAASLVLPSSQGATATQASIRNRFQAR